jgi:hypothetical protein
VFIKSIPGDVIYLELWKTKLFNVRILADYKKEIGLGSEAQKYN